MGSVIDDRYQVLSKIAAGGMSVVYLAIDTRLDRHVALKVLHHHLVTDSRVLDRLSQEAKAAAKLSHPHVVGMLDQGSDGDLAYLVMEYIPGQTLRDVMEARGKLTPRLALAYLDAIVEGLGAAHAAGLVHRDVKPENVLLADDGRIKIGDFGLSRAVSTSTSTSSLLGTVAYLAPELVNGHTADARSDIYSVGIMLYEMLVGHPPYQGDVPVSVLMQHINSTVPAPSWELPGLSGELDELVRFCTEPDPESRPANGFALLEDLRHIRRTLSDEELDYTQSSGGQTTEDLGQRTELIDNRFAGTSLLPTQHETAYLPQQLNSTTMIDRPSPREAKKSARQAQKDRARNAAIPTAQLRRGNSRRRGYIWLAIVLVLAVLAGIAGWFFGIGPGSLGTVPDVHNQTVAQAQATLSAQGFSSNTRDVNDETVPAGLVVSSDPGPKSSQRRFLGVALLVSKGPVLHEVPTLTNGTLDAAKTALNQASLALGTVTEHYDEQAAAGTVLSQDPKPGANLRGATPINLVVSKGPQPINVPSVVGQAQDVAAKALTDAGLTVQYAANAVNDKTIPAGAVVSQTPAGGTLTKGSPVTLTLSKGPKMVHVPSYIGKQADVAIKELEKLGFKVKKNDVLGGFFGTVRDQSPVDKDVPEGSTITITVV